MTNIQKTTEDKIFSFVAHFLAFIALVLVAYPLIFVVSASFSNPDLVMKEQVKFLPKDVSLAAYRRVFANKDIMMGYKNTIIYTIVGTAVNLVLTVMGAYPLSRKELPARNFFMFMISFTMFFGGGLIPTYLVIKRLNLVNNFWVMILPGAVSAYNLILVRTFFQTSIPSEIEEAAVIDGCNNIQALIKIVLPLSIPILSVMVIFYSVGHWNAYFNALIYLTDRPKLPLQLILREILVQSQVSGDMMDAGAEDLYDQMLLAEIIKYAVAVVASVPVLLLYPILQKYFIKGIMVGAIKG